MYRFFYFFFYRALAVTAPRNVSQPAGLLYLPYALEVPTCTARRPQVYNDARNP
jgi:hypothetical protein